MCFFSNLVKRRKQREYIAGYDWAAGVLLRGELSPQEVNVSNFGDRSHSFDRGAMDALQRLDFKPLVRPCPHCGSTDLLGPNLSEYCGDAYDPKWWIECSNCPCGMEVYSEDREDLISAWNKRA